ncbi:MAG: sulfurtransferase-like selenium metabolism protein YedF [Candidatus Obscuribacterales bacterium]|nr:sulfurtransferase-like selenium metabolism protein YedF [Candidatus Obscuribacterales bacterium]
MNKEIDLRGLVCPEPVLRTKKLLDDGNVARIVALVESEVNVRNLERLARSQKVAMESEIVEDYYRVVIKRGQSSKELGSTASQLDAAEQTSPQVGTVVFLGKDTFGDGDEEFSRSLLNVFLQTMFDSGHFPRAVLMANTGVRLLDPDSPSRPVLVQFKEAGCDVLACGLCVDYYGLKGKIDPGDITNMFAICEFLMTADKVLSP